MHNNYPFTINILHFNQILFANVNEIDDVLLQYKYILCRYHPIMINIDKQQLNYEIMMIQKMMIILNNNNANNAEYTKIKLKYFNNHKFKFVPL